MLRLYGFGRFDAVSFVPAEGPRWVLQICRPLVRGGLPLVLSRPLKRPFRTIPAPEIPDGPLATPTIAVIPPQSDSMVMRSLIIVVTLRDTSMVPQSLR